MFGFDEVLKIMQNFTPLPRLPHISVIELFLAKLWTPIAAVIRFIANSKISREGAVEPTQRFIGDACASCAWQHTPPSKLPHLPTHNALRFWIAINLIYDIVFRRTKNSMKSTITLLERLLVQIPLQSICLLFDNHKSFLFLWCDFLCFILFDQIYL